MKTAKRKRHPTRKPMSQAKRVHALMRYCADLERRVQDLEALVSMLADDAQGAPQPRGMPLHIGSHHGD